MKDFLPVSNTMVGISWGLLIAMIVALIIFTAVLLVKLKKLKEYITKEKVDIAATIISIILIAMCIGGIIVYIFCMNAFV
ncbi:MAG: hypothetical protein IJD45_06125 [Clostridia bacterium]|nr:hypothetical protein [Clostridia bacterium]